MAQVTWITRDKYEGVFGPVPDERSGGIVRDGRLQMIHWPRMENIRRGIDEFVYFIESGEWGPIKIGVALVPEVRLRSLQVGNPHPLHIVAVLPGGYKREAELHRQFRGARISGEWFDISWSDLSDVITPSANRI